MGRRMTRRLTPGRVAAQVLQSALFCLAGGWFLPAAAQDAPPPERLAIVVGNSDYAQIPDLANVERDARGMADLLRQFGFDVREGYNLDRQGFETLLREALLNLGEGSEVVFYYAGHGIQIGRRNYLLPVDAAFGDVYDLPVYSITLDRVIDALAARGATQVAIIDACRENPFPNLRLAADLDAEIFEAKTGFEVIRTPINSLVAYSTSPGEVALDGEDGGNSPYTGAILATVKAEPGEDAMRLFADVREEVHAATQGRQVPWESSTLVQPFTFAGDTMLLATAEGEPSDDGATATTEGDLVIAQSDANDATSVIRDTAAPAASVSVTLPLDRTVDLTSALESAIGAALVAPSPGAAPQKGQFAQSSEGRVVYRPELAEIRATDMKAYAHEDSFRIEAGPDGARQLFDVSLRLDADPCDLAAGDALDLDGVGLYRLPNEIVVTAALDACGAAVATHPETARFRYQLGRAQQAAGSFEDAFASFTAAADAGHTRALNAAAYLLFTSRIDRDLVDIPLDENRANALLDQGIAAGDPFAMHARGLRLLRRSEAADDRTRGFELMERAAELGHTYSMNELGVYFLEPETDHYIPERGLKYLQASAEREDIFGYHNLGIVALFGFDGREPDFARAARMFEIAAAGGHPFAPADLGRMVVRGQIAGAGKADAVKWYDMGLSRGDGWGGTNAAEVILEGGVTGMGPPEAAIRAAKAAHLPDRDAAGQARALLGRLSAGDLNRGLQLLLAELGEPVEIDGAVGPGTLAALDRVLGRAGVAAPGGGAEERLLAAAKAYWAERPTRPDLF